MTDAEDEEAGQDEEVVVSEALRRAEPHEDELERLHPASWGWALACCRFDRGEAEDVLQIAYLKAIDGRARFDGRSDLRTWFLGVIRTTALETRRRRVVRTFALRRWFEGRPRIAPVPTPERASSEAETCRKLQRSLLSLSARQRELLHLVFYQDMTIEEAAGVLRISVGTARTHYERGKARLRSLLEQREATT